MKKQLEVKWLDLPEEHDYPAAQSYLELLFPTRTVNTFVQGLRDAAMTGFKAKDVFRASRLSLLGVSNSHVKKNIAKIKAGKPLSPILLVRNRETGSVIIADGYHRMCAVYQINEDIIIPAKIV